jgi:hypothetical protein
VACYCALAHDIEVAGPLKLGVAFQDYALSLQKTLFREVILSTMKFYVSGGIT